MANPNQLLYNVLQECSLPNAADVAAKLIEEEVFWSHITDRTKSGAQGPAP